MKHADYPETNKRHREQQTLLKSVSGHGEKIPVWEQLATDQTDPWQIFTKDIYTTNPAC